MRAWLFATVTDLWGAVPYSEALKGTAETPNYVPAYNSQVKVYEGILNDLKLTNDKIVVGGPAVQGDILYGGDLLKCKKFANSLRLRLANRQAAKKQTESRAIMKEILGDATKYPVFTSNADNAVIKNTATIPGNNEWHEVMIRGGRTDWNISSTLTDKLNGLKDTRITIFANANKDGKYVGHPNGLPDAIATTYLASSSTIGNYFVKADSPSVIMTYAELNLILAEAVLDGDVTGDTKTYFEKGVNASFEQFGLKAPTDYFTTVGTITREKVLDQKWIALFGQGLEAWTEYRRTGFRPDNSHHEAELRAIIPKPSIPVLNYEISFPGTSP